MGSTAKKRKKEKKEKQETVRKTVIKEMSYVCIPSVFSIRMKHQMVTKNDRTGLGVHISILHNDKLIFSNSAISEKSFTSRFTYDEILKDVLKEMFNLNRNKFIKYILNGDIHGIQFYDKLKLVQSKLGTTMFKR